MKDYSSENVTLIGLSDLTPELAEALIGKTVAKVNGREYGLTLIFTDGSELEVYGSTYGGCALSVDYTEKPEKE